MLNSIKKATAQFKRLAIANFWMTRADALERQAVAIFREAGTARESAKSALRLDDAGAESVFGILMNNDKVVKTVVEPDDGEGKVN